MRDISAYLRSMLTQGRASGCFPSAAVAVGAKDAVLGQAFIGEAPLPGGAPVDAHTRYDMASLSKVLGTTMVALKAIEAGGLHLDDTVGGIFPQAPADKRDITVFMLMTHTGGFHPSFRLDHLLTDPGQAVDCILRHPLEDRPGTRPIYSCMGYILLGKMLEKIYGQPLKDLAADRVFSPLGMTETGYCPAPGPVFAATEVDPATGQPWIGVVHDENARFLGGNSGNAGVFMPLCDGIAFAKMLATGGGGFLRPDTLRQATGNYTPGQDAHRGLGFQIAGTPDCFFSAQVPDHCFGHTGFTGTSLMVEPETGFWVILLTNRVYPTRDSAALFPFRRQLHGECWHMFLEGR
ncbi:MAG: beta-lactamase family protein [Clostridia bacterium]|nr:beta-lactamase family protein [Clostridia bacterium]